MYIRHPSRISRPVEFSLYSRPSIHSTTGDNFATQRKIKINRQLAEAGPEKFRTRRRCEKPAFLCRFLNPCSASCIRHQRDAKPDNFDGMYHTIHYQRRTRFNRGSSCCQGTPGPVPTGRSLREDTIRLEMILLRVLPLHRPDTSCEA